jgi:hypothetical protein
MAFHKSMSHSSCHTRFAWLGFFLSVVHSYHFSIDTSKPPYLLDVSGNQIHWDTGKIARVLAVSQSVLVSYQGIFTIPRGYHVLAPDWLPASHRLNCVEMKHTLCQLINSSLVLFPTANYGTVHIPVNPHIPGVPHIVDALSRSGCTQTSSGAGRIVSDLPQYAITSCNLDAMQYSFFLHEVITVTYSLLVSTHFY